jgi:hypothetical protein
MMTEKKVNFQSRKRCIPELPPVLKWRLWFESVPGPYEQYDGKVDVLARNRDFAIEAAYRELYKTYQRGRAMWKLLKVQIVPERRTAA